MLNWYLVYTKPKNEDIVSQKFSDAGFEVFNPKLKERRVIRRRLQEVVSQLFPCYIFVKFDNPRDYSLIQYTRGVRRVVGIYNTPSVVFEEIITSIRGRMEEGMVTIRPRFQPGEGVLIKAGPFEGLDAIFEKELKGIERVSILLRAINARIIVDGAILSRN